MDQDNKHKSHKYPLAELTTEALKSMRAEVYETNKANGWYDRKREFADDIALLHTEISEAFEAYRKWGLDDPDINQDTNPDASTPGVVKPEGVGSELADVLIRLLDTAHRLDIDLDSHGVDWIHPAMHIQGRKFGSQISELHTIVATAWLASNSESRPAKELVQTQLNLLLVSLQLICYDNNIDLYHEYKRKMTYNRTRSYRHGNKIV